MEANNNFAQIAHMPHHCLYEPLRMHYSGMLFLSADGGDAFQAGGQLVGW